MLDIIKTNYANSQITANIQLIAEEFINLSKDHNSLSNYEFIGEPNLYLKNRKTDFSLLTTPDIIDKSDLYDILNSIFTYYSTIHKVRIIDLECKSYDNGKSIKQTQFVTAETQTHPNPFIGLLDENGGDESHKGDVGYREITDVLNFDDSEQQKPIIAANIESHLVNFKVNEIRDFLNNNTIIEVKNIITIRDYQKLLDYIVNQLKLLPDNRQTLVYYHYSCHSNCHNSCHGSRSRR